MDQFIDVLLFFESIIPAVLQGQNYSWFVDPSG